MWHFASSAGILLTNKWDTWVLEMKENIVHLHIYQHCINIKLVENWVTFFFSFSKHSSTQPFNHTTFECKCSFAVSHFISLRFSLLLRLYVYMFLLFIGSTQGLRVLWVNEWYCLFSLQLCCKQNKASNQQWREIQPLQYSS